MCDECSLCHVLPPHGCGVWAQESLPPDVKYLHIEREGGREGEGKKGGEDREGEQKRALFLSPCSISLRSYLHTSCMASLKQWKLYSMRPCLSNRSSLSRHTSARNLRSIAALLTVLFRVLHEEDPPFVGPLTC